MVGFGSGTLVLSVEKYQTARPVTIRLLVTGCSDSILPRGFAWVVNPKINHKKEKEKEDEDERNESIQHNTNKILTNANKKEKRLLRIN